MNLQYDICLSVKWLLWSGSRQGAPLNPPGVIGPGLQSLWSCVGSPQMLPGQAHPHAVNGKTRISDLTPNKETSFTYHMLERFCSITRIILGLSILSTEVV